MSDLEKLSRERAKLRSRLRRLSLLMRAQQRAGLPVDVTAREALYAGREMILRAAYQDAETQRMAISRVTDMCERAQVLLVQVKA